jgi:hypothetical protein
MKPKEFKSNMNKTQKYFVIIGVMSFVYWFISPLYSSSPINAIIENFVLDLDFLPFTYYSDWYKNGFQMFSFALMIGSGLGYYLFKDD